MATVEKRGNTYRITVSNGYDISGKQLREKMTWTPEPNMTSKTIEKELNRQVTLFEEKVKSSTQDSRIRFVDFSEKYMEDYARLYLKDKTRTTYEEHLAVINQAIGHIRLRELKTAHINSFYRNLQEAGVRNRVLAKCKIDFAKWIEDSKLSLAKLSAQTGISRWTLSNLKSGKAVDKACAEVVAAAFGVDAADMFTFEKDMTPYSPATIQAYHRTLSSVLSRAVKWGYIQFNPAENAEKPSQGAREAAYLDEADARTLLELLRSEPIKWRALVTFDLLSGLRRGELLGLRWSDVDLDDKTLVVSQTSNYLPGKGVYVGTPKTASSARPMRLSNTAVALLEEYKRWQDDAKAAAGDAWVDEDGRVFTTETGAPLFPDSLTAWFRRFVDKTNLPHVHLHSLRHTYASMMIADGAPLVVVSRQLGHANVSTTNNIYSHVIASVEAKAVQTFDRFGDIVALSTAPKPNILNISKDNEKAAGR